MVSRPKNPNDDSLLRSIFDKTNLTNFSDAVIAIAITILVLDLKIEDIAPDNVDAMLSHAFFHIIPILTSFTIGFFVIAYYWYSYHRFMKHVNVIDTVFVLLNLFLLFLIVFLPFPTSILGSFLAKTSAVILYSAVIAGIGLTTFLMRLYAWRLGKLIDTPDEKLLRSMTIQPLMSTIIYLASIPVAFINPVVSIGMWLVAPVIYGVILRWIHRTHFRRHPAKESALIGIKEQ